MHQGTLIMSHPDQLHLPLQTLNDGIGKHLSVLFAEAFL